MQKSKAPFFPQTTKESRKLLAPLQDQKFGE